MICPLLTLASQDETPGGAPLHDCIEAMCAWWDDDWKRCSIRSIPQKLYRVAHNLLVAARIEAPPQ